MADLRIPSAPNLPTTTRSVAPVRTEAAKAAQRAFFQAAFGQGQPTAAPASAQPPVASAPATRATAARPVQVTPVKVVEVDPQRPLRPGSLLDIKV